MTTIVEPAAEFHNLTKGEIMKALADRDPTNRIAGEVARLVAGYTANFAAHVQRLDRIPSEILHATPRTPIEAVAMRLTTEAITDTIAARRG